MIQVKIHWFMLIVFAFYFGLIGYAVGLIANKIEIKYEINIRK